MSESLDEELALEEQSLAKIFLNLGVHKPELVFSPKRTSATKTRRASLVDTWNVATENLASANKDLQDMMIQNSKDFQNEIARLNEEISRLKTENANLYSIIDDKRKWESKVIRYGSILLSKVKSKTENTPKLSGDDMIMLRIHDILSQHFNQVSPSAFNAYYSAIGASTDIISEESCDRIPLNTNVDLEFSSRSCADEKVVIDMFEKLQKYQTDLDPSCSLSSNERVSQKIVFSVLAMKSGVHMSELVGIIRSVLIEDSGSVHSTTDLSEFSTIIEKICQRNIDKKKDKSDKERSVEMDKLLAGWLVYFAELQQDLTLFSKKLAMMGLISRDLIFLKLLPHLDDLYRAYNRCKSYGGLQVKDKQQDSLLTIESVFEQSCVDSGIIPKVSSRNTVKRIGLFVKSVLQESFSGFLVCLILLGFDKSSHQREFQVNKVKDMLNSMESQKDCIEILEVSALNLFHQCLFDMFSLVL